MIILTPMLVIMPRPTKRNPRHPTAAAWIPACVSFELRLNAASERRNIVTAGASGSSDRSPGHQVITHCSWHFYAKRGKLRDFDSNISDSPSVPQPFATTSESEYPCLTSPMN
ncbi:hypothetical protein ASPCAL12518 [Aspergillus calidoustus]|uniref:Uncharacterized protein n=1 Tax=Aspergillus calidoustus TaxID=454130 RepID=A0A0U5GCB2_ASPCI|nr:hypothetical protein ASPCAL12518 [Aspergillus calidoustus]